MPQTANIQINLDHKVIVLVYMLYFGDTVALTPFLERLRNAAPNSKLILVLDGNCIDAVKYNPNIDVIVPVYRKEIGIYGTWKLGEKLRKYKPDIFFCLHGTSRTSILGLATQAKVWIGEPGTRFDWMFMKYSIPIFSGLKHASIAYLDLLELLGIPNAPCDGFKLYSCAEWDEEVQRFFSEYGVKKGDKLAGYSVGSSTLEKDWPAERFGQVASYFAKKGYRPVFFGIKREMDLVKRAVAGLHCDPIIAAGKFSMGEFISAVSWCSVGFTNDSGPMYVFDGRGVPTVAMFGPSNAKRHYPMGKRSVAISSWDMPLEQDHVNHTIRDGNYVSIDHISVEDVICAGEWALGLRESNEYSAHIKYVES